MFSPKAVSGVTLKVSLFIVCWLPPVAVFAQVSVPGWTDSRRPAAAQKPPIAERAAKGEAPLSRKYDSIRIEAAPLHRLPAPRPEELRPKNAEKKLRIGVNRRLPQPLDESAGSSFFDLPEGRAGVMRVGSAGAVQIRLHFSRVALSANARLFVYSAKNPDEFYGPYRRDDGGDFWTPPLEGEEAVVEFFAPDGEQPEFQIVEVSHIFTNPRDRASQRSASQNCQRDVTAEWSETAKSVALLQFTQPDGEYLCTGTLLNDAGNSGTPYLLTANHCFNTQRVANSLRAYWFFDGAGTNPDNLPRSVGAKLLSTGAASDFTLIELRSAPPAGSRYSGWTTALPSPSSAVAGIHHPEGEYKRIAFGSTVTDGCGTDAPEELCDNFLKVRWSSGVTSPGSSGSGLWVGPASDPRLAGVLLGGRSACNNQSGTDFYGRFDLAFQSVAWFLSGRGCAFNVSLESQIAPASGGSGTVNVTPREGDDCSWTASTNASWITINSGRSGAGDGVVSYSIAPNNSSAQRTAQLTIAGAIVVITQQGNDYNCAPATIALGQTVNGELNASGCRSIVNPAAKAVRYQFAAPLGQAMTIKLNTTAFDGYLALLGPNGELIAEDDDGGGGNQARIPSGDYQLNWLTLPYAGTYTIEVTSLDDRAAGAFTLKLEKDCVFVINRRTQTASASGRDFLNGTIINGAIEFEVKADVPGACATLVTSTDPWLHSSGYITVNQGNNRTTISVDGNSLNRQRSGIVTVAGVPVVVRQYPYCNDSTRPTISPSSLSFDGRGGAGNVNVTMAAGAFCTWNFEPPPVVAGGNIITIVSPIEFLKEGTGTGALSYNVGMYPGIKPLSRAITISGQPHTVTQTPAGASCQAAPLVAGQKVNGALASTDCVWLPVPNSFADHYSLSGAAGNQVAFNFSSPDQPVTFAVFDPDGKPIADSSGNFGQKEFRYPANGYLSLPVAGVFTLVIHGAQGRYSVELERVGGPNCVYSLPAYPNDRADFGPEGGMKEIPLTATEGCDWTITGAPNWITFPEGASGRGSKVIKLVVAANAGAIRNATLSIAGRSYIVVQNAPCSYVRVRPNYSGAEFGSKLYIEPRAATMGFTIVTGNGCPLRITSQSEWLTEPAIFNDQGYFKHQANTTGQARTGILDISGQKIEVVQGAENLTTVSAAAFTSPVAPQSIASVFGENLAKVTASATTLPLPTELGGTIVFVRANSQFETVAPLFFVSPTQINFQIPEDVSTANPVITVFTPNSLISSSRLNLQPVAPSLFSASASGQGVAAAVVLRIKADGTQSYEPVARFDSAQNRFVAVPIDPGAPSDQVFLLLFGTGLRNRSSLSSVTAKIDSADVETLFAGAQGGFVGLDQVNLRLPRSLAGRGEVDVVLTVEGKVANAVKIAFK
jgi:uncharacterized protein (TIGR03437 family)